MENNISHGSATKLMHGVRDGTSTPTWIILLIRKVVGRGNINASHMTTNYVALQSSYSPKFNW